MHKVKEFCEKNNFVRSRGCTGVESRVLEVYKKKQPCVHIIHCSMHGYIIYIHIYDILNNTCLYVLFNIYIYIYIYIYTFCARKIQMCMHVACINHMATFRGFRVLGAFGGFRVLADLGVLGFIRL